MTKKEANKYARECAYAKAKANREGTEYIKPERPENANSVTALNDVLKAIITARTSLHLLTTQMDMIVDYLCEMQDRSACAKAYAEMAGNILGTLVNTEVLLKSIR